MALAIKRLPQILEDMIAWIIANQTKVTDFNEGAVIRTYCEAVGLEIEDFYIKARVGFSSELKEIPFYAFKFERESAQNAAGSVVFSRSGTSGDVTIPAGTLISTSDGIRFTTNADVDITNGNNDSAAVGVTANEGGKLGNVAAATITVIVTPTGAETVTNASGATGGQDEETEAEYLTRFQQFIEGLSKSNNAGLIAGAKEVVGVRSASLEEHFPPSSGYNVTLYIDDGAGNASAALITEVEEKLIGDGTTASPGYKAAGINLQVLAPTKINVSVTIVITDDGSLSQASIEYLVEEAIEGYINNLEIGEDVILNEIRNVVMDVDGVYDIAISLPSSNTSIGDGQIARTNVITLSFS